MNVRQAALALLAWGGMARAQGPAIHLIDAGPGSGPQVLEAALARPYVVIGPGQSRAVLSRDSTYSRTVIVLGREAAVEARVTGDVIVVGGDLHVHPRANISGRAIAIGGGVYESALADIHGGSLALRDFTYDVTPVPGGYELRYRALTGRPVETVGLSGIYGFRIPSYDRTNGLSVPVGVTFAARHGAATLEPRLTYRSQLGAVDPGVDATYLLDSRTTLTATAQRGTFSNDAWIWSDLLNSLGSLAAGHDTRNYFRAWRADLTASRSIAWESYSLAPYVGARWERDESARPGIGVTSGPWSLRGRRDPDDMFRPNPLIDSGTVVSARGGATFMASRDDVVVSATLDVEAGALSPKAAPSARFVQTTFDGAISFPTFGTQSLRLEGHAVASSPGTPRQRWAYIGGAGTIPTIDLLSRGGDRLIYFDGRYRIPIDRFTLPFIGPPAIVLREALGGADVKRWPSLAQATGVRIALNVVYLEFLVDPATRHHYAGVGLSMAP